MSKKSNVAANLDNDADALTPVTMAASSDDGYAEVTGGGANSKASVFLKPAYLKINDVIQGIVQSFKEEVGKFGHPVLFMTLNRDITYGDNKNAEKTYKAGESVGINVPGQLSSLLTKEGVTGGSDIRLTYLGKQEIEGDHDFAGSQAHTFKLAMRKA